MSSASQERVEELPQLLSVDLDGNFERLMRAYQDRLYAFALRLSNNSQDAEEIVQDAFVRAYRALQRYLPERTAGLALRPWLYQVTLNVFRNRARVRRLNTVSLDGAPDGAGLPEPPDRERDRPAAVAERSDRRDWLAALVAELPERYRAPLVLRYVEELSYAEVAQALGQPVGTVKANVHRAIEQLRAAIARREDVSYAQESV